MLSIHLLKAHIKDKKLIVTNLRRLHHFYKKFLRIFGLVLIKFLVNLLFKTLYKRRNRKSKFCLKKMIYLGTYNQMQLCIHRHLSINYYKNYKKNKQ